MKISHDQVIARVGLIIKGDMLASDDVTAALGMQPTRSFAKGDVISKRYVERKHSRSLWALEIEGTEVEDVAVRLLEALRGKEEVLQKVSAMKEVDISISIWWETPEGQGGFTLSSAILAQLCALSTQIHVYLPGATMAHE